jgi:transposase-like protein
MLCRVPADPVLEPMTLFSGRDYPRSYREFATWFQDDSACAAFLETLRWPNGFTCPACGSVREPWRESRGRLVCRTCRHQTTVTVGTILEKTRTPLSIWFEAAWHVTTTKNGFSAKSLERTLGIRYRVAWTLLQRFRVAMVRAERRPLSGIVEVDEALVGGVEHDGKRGRGTEKPIVAIGLEIHQPKGFGRVRTRQVPDASDASLRPFVCETVVPGSIVHTDGWSGYNRLSQSGYVHQRTIMSASDDPAHVAMPGVHRIASLLKRWILGTHQGSVSDEHLQAYLEEFTFRFNRRTSRSRGLLFRRLLEQLVGTAPVSESKLIHGYDWLSDKI